jgi:hypothetical protein
MGPWSPPAESGHPVTAPASPPIAVEEWNAQVVVSALSGSGRDEFNPALDQGLVLDDDAKASFTTAESFNQPQASELSTQAMSKADYRTHDGGGLKIMLQIRNDLPVIAEGVVSGEVLSHVTIPQNLQISVGQSIALRGRNSLLEVHEAHQIADN